MPDLELERAAGGIVAGVDEAGRGPLAGPVLAAAAVIDPARLTPALQGRIDDSKKLSAARRAAVLDGLAGCTRIGLGAASVAEIDRLNILGATLLAMRRAVLALAVLPDVVLVDGNRAPDLPCPGRSTVIKRRCPLCLSIAAASIAAKVTRDRIDGQSGLGTPPIRVSAGNATPATGRRRTARRSPGSAVNSRTIGAAFAPISRSWEMENRRPRIRRLRSKDVCRLKESAQNQLTIRTILLLTASLVSRRIRRP